jgi:tRNA(Ile)-lysidine synthase
MHIGQAISSAILSASSSIVDAEQCSNRLSTREKAGGPSCIWVGLSAGVDSTVLLHALVQDIASPETFSGNTRIKAIHVHHGLSSNADAWAQQAEALCVQLSSHSGLSIECIIERVQLENSSDGLEQAARQARYHIFEKHCQNGDVLLQGHHLDDQIETFFMRALRGSGLTGLSGIPKQRNLSRGNTCQILRPLLPFEKSQLIEYATEHQLTWVEDESNKNSKIDRNWWRNELLPKIWQRYPNQKQALSRTINNIQHEQGLLQQIITEKIDSHHSLQQLELKIHPALQSIPRFDLRLIESFDQPIALSYLRAWLAQHVDVLPSSIQMQSIYIDMIDAKVDAKPSFSWIDKSLYRYQGHLFLWFGRDYLKVIRQNENDWSGESQIYSLGLLSCCKKEKEQSVGLKPATYSIRLWQEGDTAKPVGRSTRKMKKWWQDYGVPSWARNYWPIIVDKYTNEIVAVPGLFTCHGYQTQEDQAKQNDWSLNWQFKRL